MKTGATATPTFFHAIGAAAGASLLMALSLSPAHADAPADVCKFGKDGVISQEAEYRVYLLHQASDVYRRFDKNCDGTLSPDEWKAYQDDLEAKQVYALHDFRDRVSGHKPTRLAKAPDPAVTDKKPRLPGWQTPIWLLRDSYSDVSAFAAPSDPKTASGAQFGWTRDAIAGNTSWNAKGVAGVAFVYFPDLSKKPLPPLGQFAPTLEAFSIVPTVRFERLANSSAKLAAKNVDVLSYGLTSEIWLGHVFDDSVHVFRLRGNFVSNFEGDSKSWVITGEWQPYTNDYAINLNEPNPVGTLPAYWEVDAVARMEYAQAFVPSTDPLFATSSHMFRAGGLVSLSFGADKGDPAVPDFLQRLTLSANYLWLADTATGHDYPLLNASIAYNFDEAGHFGIKFSVQKGRVEETAVDTDSTGIAITSKF